MREIEIINWQGLNNLYDNEKYYKQLFLNNKVLAFRNVNADNNLQKKIMFYFGDIFGWYPNSLNKNLSDYFEDHHRHFINNRVITKNELVLGWHVEWVQYEDDPHYGATWNMTKFECEYDNGNTNFIDTEEVYNLLEKKDAEFLLKCKVLFKEPYETKHAQKYFYIKNHWMTGSKCVRPFLGNFESTSLIEFNGNSPTENEKNIFNKIHKDVFNLICTNQDIKYVHRWQKGDLLVPDLFKLAHSVSGGFKKNERRLDGMFGKLKPWALQ